MDRRNFMVGASAAALAAGLPFRGAGAATYPADYNAIIEGSKAEGKLLVYSSMTEKMWSGVNKRYAELYPWVKVETLDLDGQVLIERYLAEKGTGSGTADFLMSASVEGWLDLQQRGEIMDYRSPELAEIPAWAMPFPGLYAINVDPVLLAWNKAVLPPDMVPTGMADLYEKAKAHPEIFRGKITTYSAEKHVLGMQTHRALINTFGDKGWEWLSTIGPMTVPADSGGPILERLVSGESVFAYFAPSATIWNATKDPKLAELIGWSFIGDAQPLLMKGAAIPVASKNVNAAKLWLDTILSREGQIGMTEGGRTAMRPDVTLKDTGGAYTYGDIVAAVGEKNTMLVGFDKETGRDEFLKRWKELFAPV